MKSLKLSMAMAIACALGTAASAGAAETLQASPATGGPVVNSTSKLSAEQLAEIRLRMELADQIAHNVAEDARSTGAPENWRGTLMNTLLGVHSSALRDIAGSAKTVFDARTQGSQATTQKHRATSATATANSALGSSTDSLVYTPMTPCRFVDTRFLPGPVGIGATPWQFDTAAQGSRYGGDANCSLPNPGEPAIAANVTLVAPATSAGYLAVRPVGSANVTSWLNFNQSGPSIAVANQGIITTAQDSSTGHYLFEMFVANGPAQIVVDFFGYFSAATPTALDCFTSKTTTVLAANSSGSYPGPMCPSGYAETAPYCNNSNQANVYSGGSGIYQGPSAPGSTAFCQFANQNSTSVNVDVGVTCCRVP